MLMHWMRNMSLLFLSTSKWVFLMAFCICCSNRFLISFTCSCNLQGYRFFTLLDRIHLPQMTNWHVFNKLLTVVWSELVIFIYVVYILILGLKALKILAISSTKVWYNIWKEGLLRKFFLTGLWFKDFLGLDNWKKWLYRQIPSAGSFLIE